MLLKKVLPGRSLHAWSLFRCWSGANGFAAQLEKDELTIGFIKLTDCAPVIIAKEKGFFEDEGLYVTLQAQANWKVLLDRVIDGQLDGAHMLPGQAIGATVGFGTKSDIVAPFAMGLNTLAVTVSNEVWAEMKKNIPQEDGKPVHPIKADALKIVVDQYKAAGKNFRWGWSFRPRPTTTNCATGLPRAASTPGITRRRILPGPPTPMC